jgi:hypothetical protein
MIERKQVWQLLSFAVHPEMNKTVQQTNGYLFSGQFASANLQPKRKA